MSKTGDLGSNPSLVTQVAKDKVSGRLRIRLFLRFTILIVNYIVKLTVTSFDEKHRERLFL